MGSEEGERRRRRKHGRRRHKSGGSGHRHKRRRSDGARERHESRSRSRSRSRSPLLGDDDGPTTSQAEVLGSLREEVRDLVWGIVEDHPEMSSDFGIIVAHFQKGKRIDINSMPDKALKSKLGGLFEVLVKHGVLSCDKGERFSGGSAVSSLSLVLELVGERPKKQEKPPIGPTMPPSAAAGPRPPIGPALPPSRKPDVGIEDLLDEEDDFVGPVQVTQGGAPLRSAGEEIERILSCAAADSFQVLGVDPDATTKQVVKRYLKLSLLIHPDKCRLANAAKAFTVLNKAKSDQLDPSKKDDALLWEMAVAEAKRRQESEDWKSIRTTGSVQKAKGPLQREEWLTNKDLPQSSYVPQQKNVTRFTR